MLRKRLTTVFALLAALAFLQGLFTVWATQQANRYAQRSVVASQMLSHYLELGANKQRLKVWFAQATLTGAASEQSRSELLSKMADSLAQLKLDNQKEQLNTQETDSDTQTIAALSTNFAALTAAIGKVNPKQAIDSPADAWKAMIAVFDESDGKDMRPLLAAAVARKNQASISAEADLSNALARLRDANIAMALLIAALAAMALIYFIKALQAPFNEVVSVTNALAQGDLNVRSQQTASNEFGHIGRSLNALALQLGHAKHENETLLNSLEDSVMARTRALSQAHNELLDIDAKRKTFFAEISHELRTPVTVIRGEADVALRLNLNLNLNPTEYKDTLTRIQLAASDLGNRVTDLLHASRTGAFGYVLRTDALPIVGVVQLALSQMQAVAHHQKIKISFNPSAQAKVWRVDIDQTRILQALMIVLDNALSYSPAHSEVSVAIGQLDDFVQVTVSDQGIGFQQAEQVGDSADFDINTLDLNNIARSPQAMLLRPDGAGLGIKIANKIMVAHHGQLSVTAKNTASIGATVVLSLPLHDETSTL